MRVLAGILVALAALPLRSADGDPPASVLPAAVRAVALDPWIEVEDHLLRGDTAAARAVATEAGDARLTAYVARARDPSLTKLETRRARAAKAMDADNAKETLRLVPRTVAGDTVTTLRLLRLRGEALRAVGMRPQSIEAFTLAGAASRKLGWLVGAAECYRACGFSALDARDVAGARRVWQTRFEIEQEIGDAVRLADAARSLAYLDSRTGRYAAARKLLERAQAWSRDAKDRPGRMAALAGLAIACEHLGDYASGFANGTEALRLAERLGRPRWRAASLGTLGVLQLRMGRFDDALSFFEESVVLRKTLRDRRGVGAMLANAGLAHLALGAFDEALEHLQDAAAIQKELGLAHDRAGTLTNLATAYRRMGAHRSARTCLEEAFEICQTLQSPSTLAAVHAGLGNTHLALGAYATALDHHLRASEIHAAAGDKAQQASSLFGLAAIHTHLGRPGRALPLYKQARSLLAALHDAPREAEALRRIGVTYDQLGESRRAGKALKRALELLVEAGDEAGQARAYAAMGNVEMRAERYEEAKVAHERALGIARRLKDAPMIASTLGNLGVIAHRMGETKEALKLQREALALATEQGLPRSALLNRWGIADALSAQGRHEEALKDARAAVEVLGQSLVGLDHASGPEAREAWAGLYEVGVRAAAALDRVEDAYFFLESGRARTLLDALGGRNAFMAATLPDELAFRDAETRAAERRALLLLRQARRSGRRGLIQLRRKDLTRARQEVAYVAERIQRSALTSADDMVRAGPASLEDVRKGLDAGDALVLFGVLHDDVLAVVVTAEEARLVNLGSAETVRTLCTSLDFRDRKRDPLPTLEKLRAQVIQPLGLSADTRRLLFVPHDVLGHVPVQLLAPERDAICIPSAGTYLALSKAARNQTAKSREVLALGDPDYGTTSAPVVATAHRLRSGAHLPRLPATRDEVKAIGDAVLLGPRASETSLRDTLASRPYWRAVHFACHGLVDAERPMLSALALSLDAESDGFLTALDVFRMRIPADLAVLSACDTGRGRDYRAEGLVGLTRAFMFAGAPRVLCSLWKVDDEATRALMVRFYELWNPKDGSQGLGAAQALREAQQYVRGHAKWKHPYFWAAWTMWGMG